MAGACGAGHGLILLSQCAAYSNRLSQKTTPSQLPRVENVFRYGGPTTASQSTTS
jgi:hypothetical protein